MQQDILINWSPQETRVAVVGFESVLGQDSNVWVRMYEN